MGMGVVIFHVLCVTWPISYLSKQTYGYILTGVVCPPSIHFPLNFQDHNKAKSSEYKIGSVFFNTLIKAKENNLRSNYIITHLPNWLNGKKLWFPEVGLFVKMVINIVYASSDWHYVISVFVLCGY